MTHKSIQHHKIHLIGNAHIDPVWLWRWTDGFSEVKATFRSALDRIKEYPGFIFTCAGACYYKWVEENCPEMFDEIRRYVAEGRWVPVNGWWIQPDCNIPCGESFARQSLYSQRYYKEKFGIICDTGYNVDSFGHSGMLPQILLKSGMKHYVFMRPMDEEKPGVPNVFRWVSADGSSVLTFKIPISYAHYNSATLREKVVETARLGSEQDSDMMLFYGVGNHGGGPTIALLDKIGELQRAPGGDDLVFSSPKQFMAAIEGDAEKYPVVKDDLQIHSIGCYSAMLEIKQLNRRAETRLLGAERFDAMAHILFGVPAHTRELAGAWEKVMFGQFHDSICGCSIRTVYDDAREFFGYSLCAAGEILNSALQRISWSIDTAGEDDYPRSKENWSLWGIGRKGSPVVVFNPLPFAVEKPVEVNGVLRAVTDAEGDRLQIQRVRSLVTNGINDMWNTLFIAKLPAVGYATFWLHKDAPESVLPEEGDPLSVSADGSKMANGFVEVSFDIDTGCITDIFDRKQGFHSVKGPFATALVIDETSSDTWGHGLKEYRDVVGSFRKTSIEVIENGPVRGIIRVAGAYHESVLVQDFMLYRDRPEIEVKAKIHWREKHKIFKLEFPIDASHARSTSEIPYGFIERPMDGTEKPIQWWTDVSGDGYGVSIINDSNYAIDVKDGAVRLTVLRSPIFADHFGVRDGLCEFMEQGERRFGYMIYPHPGDWRKAGTIRKAMALNTPASVVYETYHKGTSPQTMAGIHVAPDNIAVTAFKMAEEGNGYILRCHETWGRDADAVIDIGLLGRRWSAHFGPSEIKTFLLPPDAGADVREVNLLEL